MLHSIRQLATPVFIPYDAALQVGTLLDRRDRFISSVRLENGDNVVDAHCINPGRMEAFVDVGARVWLLPAPEATAATRKLKFSWEAIEQPHALTAKNIMCGTNTQRPNRLMRALLEARCLPGLDAWSSFKAEPKFDVLLDDGIERHKGRSDFLLLTDDDDDDEKTRTESPVLPSASATSPAALQHYVEVKNCHMVYEDGWAYFPDSVSERAARHCEALAALARDGHRATVVFVVQRADVLHGVRPSAWHDPAFAAAAARAAASGVQFRALRADVAMDGTRVTHELPVDVDGALEPSVVAAVGEWCARNQATTGWTRSQSGARVANGAFAHNQPKKTGGGRKKPAAPRTSTTASASSDGGGASGGGGTSTPPKPAPKKRAPKRRAAEDEEAAASAETTQEGVSETPPVRGKKSSSRFF